MSLVKAFDKKAAYGEVFGAPGVAYDQNGHFYNYDYEPVDLQGNILKVTAPKPEAKTAVAAPVTPPATDDTDDDTPEDEKPLDLQAWVKGELPGARFFAVKAAVKAQFGKEPKNAAEAKQIILGE